MSDANKLNLEINDIEISKKVKKSFLDYAMSVIVSRAIPDVYDGLKPVQRRIIYSMFTSGYTPDKPYKKSVRIVGDVLGRFHPHGDTAVYGALVRMAQSFSMRNILIDGHGNFGSIDGDEAAAYRYTEARLTKLSLQLVRDIECDVVDFMTNYDGVDKEPVTLPSRFPNLLVNGSSGIAVGMATNIPPHNLRETIDAVIALAKNPYLTVDEIMEKIHGPDFPTGGIILGNEGIKKAYETGTGSVIIRAKYHFEQQDKKNIIVIDEIPYGVNKAELVKSISVLAKETIDGITRISDESNMKGIRIAISIRSDCIPEIIINKLFSLTKLQTSFNIIFLCLEKNEPKVMPIKLILSSYLDYQINVITRRTIFLKNKDSDRKIIVLGLLTAIDNINEIVEIIKKSSTSEDATKKIMSLYSLKDEQVQAILAMTLKRLTGLEKNKLLEELKEIEKRLLTYEHILENRENKLNEIIKELEEIKNQFGDDRKTDILLNVRSEINEEEMIPNKGIIVSITKNGYLKRTDLDMFRKQNIGGVGAKGMEINDSDFVRLFIQANTHDNLLFFSTKGKVYSFKGYKIPDYGKNAKGIPAQNFFCLDKSETIVSIINQNNEKYLTFVTKKGLIKKTEFKEYLKIKKNGKIAIKLNEGDDLLDIKYTNGNSLICLATKKGKAVVFNEGVLRATSRGTIGVRGIRLEKDDEVVGFCTSLEGEKILAVTENGYGKITNMSEYRITKRNAKGVKIAKITNKSGCLVTIKTVLGNEDLMVVTNKGIAIRFSISCLRSLGRVTQGIKFINLKQGQKISSATVCFERNYEEDGKKNNVFVKEIKE